MDHIKNTFIIILLIYNLASYVTIRQKGWT